ncbi:uncharacterized protein LOC127867950 isoform X2 [Dreissena polymorpha]|uniref:uncharacterized protein LOC127867950 isoform X2 n=1 Tax=Dreissena polymorpha TaxID=45954 RepID=UPI002265092A|nr:uncharacterized protein LOC127867950 isoform X2 [Dreissena polymorpha]
MNTKIYFFIVLCVGFVVIDFAKAKIQVTTLPAQLQIEWDPSNISVQSWDLTYDVMGTEYHGVLDVIGTSFSVNVSTDQYPGSLYKVSVYQVVNGTRQLYGIGYGRANCSTSFHTVIGDTNSLRFPGYSRVIPSGVVCTWNFVGTVDTWYRIQVSDFNIKMNESCGDYVTVNDGSFCNTSMWISSKIITNSSFSVKLFTKSSKGGPFEFIVTAVHRLYAPTNVTAYAPDDVINVTWEPPSYHPENFTYTLRLAHYPFTSFLDMTLEGNATSYSILLTSHFGQNFTVQIRSVSADVTSDFGTPIFVRTSCKKDYFIKETQQLFVTSEQFPNNYLPDVHCTFTFKTNDEFILRILTHTLDISGSSFCRVPPFLEINGERFCSDHLPSPIIVHNTSMLEMIFDSGLNTRGVGFNFSIQSVAQQPSPPQNVHATVEQDEIRISWAPPAHRQAYVSLYTVQYVLPPHTPGATMVLTQESRNFTIDTHGYSGRLYVFRMSASTDGGQSAFTAPLYVRASCGNQFRLERHQEVIILSPGSTSAYSPAVVCNWSVVAPPNNWLKLIMQEFHLEDSVNCTKDSLSISGQEPLCGNQTGSYIFRRNSLDFRFTSDYDIERRGFHLVIISEGPTPGAPENVSMQTTQYGIVVQWRPPPFRTEFVNGYAIIYVIGNDGSNHTDRVIPKAHYHVIDMTSFTGRMVNVWIRSIGDVEDSVAVPVGKIRTFCGGVVEIGLEPVYISSPGYGKATPAGILCDWSIRTTHVHNTTLRFALISLELINVGSSSLAPEISCGSYLRIDNVTRCAGIGEAEEMELTQHRETTLTFQTGDADVESRFLIRLETYEYSVISDSPLQSSSTRVSILPSSASACATCAAVMTTLSPLLTSLSMTQFLLSRT